MSDENPKAPEIQLHISPSQLRDDRIFQQNFDKVKPKMTNVLMHMQTQWAKKYEGQYEELGRRISVLADVFDVLDQCVSPEYEKGGTEPPRFMRLNNGQSKR